MPRADLPARRRRATLVLGHVATTADLNVLTRDPWGDVRRAGDHAEWTLGRRRTHATAHGASTCAAAPSTARPREKEASAAAFRDAPLPSRSCASTRGGRSGARPRSRGAPADPRTAAPRAPVIVTLSRTVPRP